VLECSPAGEAYHSSQLADIAPLVFDDGGFIGPGLLLGT
jgi:hypothetical protein